MPKLLPLLALDLIAMSGRSIVYSRIRVS